MIDFPINYPQYVANNTDNTLCGIPTGQSVVIGPYNIDATISMYENYSQSMVDSLISGDLSATDDMENPIDGYAAAIAFTNVHSRIINYQNTKISYQKTLSVSEYIQLPELTTAERDSINPKIGMMIFNTDTAESETYHASGWTNSKGPQGAMGSQGNAGVAGPQGNAGTNGSQGIIGPQGPIGNQGGTGIGIQGPQGNNGNNGAHGHQGSIGPQGNSGNNGSQGPTGPQGTDGTQGVHSGLSYQYTYTTSTSTTEPTSGIIAFDDTDFSAVTMMYMNAISADSVDTSGLAAMLADLTNPLKGSYRISSTSDTSQYAYFSIVNPTFTLTGSGYVYTTETDYLGGNISSFTDTSPLIVTFTLRGADGAQGNAGSSGSQGNQGAIGPQGSVGSGVQGPQGNSGSQGNQGAIGPQGSVGSGVQGPQGNAGPQGPQVDTSGLVANVAGAQQVTAIEVVSALPGTQSSTTLYFILE